MYRYQGQLLLSFLLMGIITACSADEATQKSLVLSLAMDNGRYHVSSYQVLNHSFKKSHQQGNYQAHLLDREGNKLREVTFQKINNSTMADEDLTVSIPLTEKLHEVVIYQMDGRSGHYQLPDESLLAWKLPESVKDKIEPIQN